MTALISVLSIIGTTTGAGMLVPQMLRLRRHPSTEGVSAKWIGVGLAMNSWWLAYSVASELWGLLPVSVVSIGLYLDIARSFVRLSPASPRRAIAVGSVMIGWIPAAFLSVAGWPAAGLAIGLCYGIQFVPAAVTVWRADRLDGVSPATWILAVIEAGAWFAYGVLTGDPALLIGGGGGGLMAIAILYGLLEKRNGRSWEKGAGTRRNVGHRPGYDTSLGGDGRRSGRRESRPQQSWRTAARR